MVARGAAVHSGLAHWAGIPCIHVVSTSHALLSFSIIVIVKGKR